MMDEGIGLAMALTLPAAAALFLAPAFFIEGIFTRGAFLSSDAEQAGLALVHYAWGVPAFVLIKVLAPGFFAREDTKTPMRFALISVVINTALGAGLFIWLTRLGHYGFPGLAIATSIAAWANALMLGFGLAKRGWYRPGIRAHIYDSKLITALIVIAIGMAAYGVAALVFGAVRFSEIKQALKRS